MRLYRVGRFIFPVVLLALFVIGLAFTSGARPVRAECGVYHTVARGQNLFRISLRYGVSIGDIAAANGIGNVNRIFVGQKLYIPCSGSTSGGNVVIILSFTPGPTVAQPSASGTQAPSLDCAGFKGTSPDAFSNGGSDIFYWDPPSTVQVARYQVRIFNEQGANVGSFEAIAPNTSISLDTSVRTLGQGTNFYWYVVGVTADNRICQTATRYAQREWPKPDPTVTPTP